ncbi:MAG TPA: beta-glucuronidase [Prevotellaceae bacterium]|nr:beta-glucuronidase [Prevotellaceae bacterium]
MKKRNILLAAVMLAASTLLAIPRAEYPRPQFERQDWVNLNGDWTYTFDFVGSGMEKKLHQSQGFSDKITVPFCPESKLSGVEYTDFINNIWYQRSITMPQAWSGKRVRLNFGAVYYNSEIFIDGQLAGRHFGGSTSFAVDITRFVADGKAHSLVVHAYSDTRTNLQPAGKQNVRMTQFECMYTRCTGIWQTVWMEPVDACGLERTQVLTDIDQNQVVIHPTFYSEGGATLTVTMSDGKKAVATRTVPAQNNSTIVLPVKKARLWSPADPFLYSLTYEVKDAAGKCIDRVSSYVGMRKIHVKGNRVYLNNEPFYQRLVLDQGFYPDGIWTAPSDEALRHDIELSLQAGFNGARLHQKVFEERFHYWADKLGYITWGEAPSWGMDANNPEVARNFLSEWSEEIVRDRNHPSIVTWTPMNEEWWPDRVQFPRFVSDVYDLTKALDPTRPVCDVSGGVHVKTDIWTTHNYEQDPKKLKDIIYNGSRWFQTPNHTLAFPQRNVGFNRHTDNNLYDFPTYDKADKPYLLDEVGGIKWVKGQDSRTGNDTNKSWGYGEPPRSLEEFYTRLEGQIDALMEISDNVWGYCYTQLTDVEQEQNGIYYYDRSSKFDMKRIHAIFSKKPAASKQ